MTSLVLKEGDIAKAQERYKGDKSIMFFSQGRIPRGESYARNIGIENSLGKYIAFVDHDCVVKEDWIEKILFSFHDVESDKKVVCLLGNHWLYQSYTIWLKLYGKYREDHAREHFSNENNLVFTNRLDGRNFALIKEVVKDFQFREDLMTEQDRELGVNLTKNGYKILFNEAMIVYHEPITLRQIIKRQYHYGLGSAIWRKTPNWFNRFYLFHFKRFLAREIGYSQLIFTMFCNFLYQLGRLSAKFR